MEKRIYYLNYHASGDAKGGSISLNGFPLGKVTEVGAEILNPYLCGKGNVLEIRTKRPMTGTIEWHEPGGVVVTGTKPEHPVRIRIDGKEADEFDLKGDATLTFETPDIDFSGLLKGDALKVPDKEILDFGEKLTKAFDTEDFETIAGAFKPKVEDYNKALPYKLSFDSFIRMMREMCKKFRIDRKEMEIVRLCNDRVYEIRRKNGEPFIYFEEGGGISRMAIFVSKVDGKLAVVR